MHYKIGLITEFKPSENEIAKIMEPYNYEKSGHRKKPFTWDYWVIGGSYGGILHHVIDAKNKTVFGGQAMYAFDSILDNITVGLINSIQKSNYNRAHGVPYISPYDVCQLIMDDDGEFIRCDGAYIKTIGNLDKLTVYGLIDINGDAIVKERWNRKDWDDTEGYAERCKEILAEAKEKNQYLTILDIHD
jgi:hypothetical protein